MNRGLNLFLNGVAIIFICYSISCKKPGVNPAPDGVYVPASLGTGTTTSGSTTGPATLTYDPVYGYLFSDGYGILQASIITNAFPLQPPKNDGQAYAYFSKTAGQTDIADPGTIHVNGNELLKGINNAYYDTVTKPGGIIFSSFPNWNIGGKNEIPAFTFTNNKPVPGFPAPGIPPNINKGINYTINHPFVGMLDSIRYTISQGSMVSISKTFPGNNTSCVFTPTDLNPLQSLLPAMVSITAFNINNASFSGKKFYFINQGVFNMHGVQVN